MSHSFELFLEAIEKLRTENQDYVIVTMVENQGSAPQDVGAKMLVTRDGLFSGTVGGGKIEAHCIFVAQKMLQEKTHHLLQKWNLQTEIGMSCGGIVGFFFESIWHESQYHVAVFGAGHIAQELVPLLIKSQFNVQCIDQRQDWLDKLPNHPRLNKICSIQPENHIDKLKLGSFICIMTMGHATDLPILKSAMRQRFQWSYVGNIGSEIKAKKLRQELKEDQIENSNDFHCPMGEEFGNNQPFEIAISILAQLLKTRDLLQS